MPFGWVDFSKDDRNKVLAVLDLLSEPGTLDELGIGAIRDGFSNLFFPGTSTIQTRAKYFLIVPYILRDLERNKEQNPKKILDLLFKEERACCEVFVKKHKDELGIIGGRSIHNAGWIKRTPADIYWAGMRQYGIFLDDKLSLSEYIYTTCSLKRQKSGMKNLGNGNDNRDEGITDDLCAGVQNGPRFWNIPTYNSDWKEHLGMRLTSDEALFLKKQIIHSFPDSMLAYFLKNDMSEVLEAENYFDLMDFLSGAPAEMREAYTRGWKFNKFLYIIRVFYNDIVSDGQNKGATDEIKRLRSDFKYYANIDIEEIMKYLGVSREINLKSFLHNAKFCLLAGNIEGLKSCIVKREISLKGESRARTNHPGEENAAGWFGGGFLDYRFGAAKTIMRDIFESE